MRVRVTQQDNDKAAGKSGQCTAGPYSPGEDSHGKETSDTACEQSEIEIELIPEGIDGR